MPLLRGLYFGFWLPSIGLPTAISVDRWKEGKAIGIVCLSIIRLFVLHSLSVEPTDLRTVVLYV